MAKVKPRFPHVPIEEVQALVKATKPTPPARGAVRKFRPATNRKEPYSIPLKP